MTLLERFTLAIAQADRNAVIIFLGTLLALAAWKSIDWLPASWHTYARLFAWAWVMIILTASILYS